MLLIMFQNPLRDTC